LTSDLLARNVGHSKALQILYIFSWFDRRNGGRDPMSDERPSAEHYRRVAAEIERLAEQSHTPEVRRELLDLAKRFKRMADRREPCPDGV
jgi:hypothetical protein